jgi:hypothetical protein
MGNATARPEYTYDITSIDELAGHMTFDVQRSNGEWDDTHEWCMDPFAVNTLMGEVPEKEKVLFEHKMLATRALSNEDLRFMAPERLAVLPWRILLKKRTIYGWRRLDKIRPTGMNEEDAIVWREKVISLLNNI